MAKEPVPDYDRQIVFFSSVVHFYSFIGYSQYSPLKSALRSLADCLRHECIPYNIKVASVFPGNFMSEGYEIEETTKPAITKKIEGPSQAVPAEECAKIVIKELSKGKETITTDFIGLVLSSSMLSGSPRSNYLAQTFFAIIFAIVAPVWEWFVRRDISDYFRKLEDEEGNTDTKEPNLI